MILCVCHGVSDRQIRAVADQGAPSVAEVGRRCGAGTDCGLCRCDIKRILRAGRGAQAQGSPTVALSK